MKISSIVVILAGMFYSAIVCAEKEVVLPTKVDGISNNITVNTEKSQLSSTLENNPSVHKPDSKKIISDPVFNNKGSMPKGNIFQLFSGLFVVIITIVIVIWLIKRFSRFTYAGQQTIKVLGGVSLGGREKIVLVEIGKTQILVGVAPGRVNLVHQLEVSIEVEQSTENFQSVLGQRVKAMFKRDNKS